MNLATGVLAGWLLAFAGCVVSSQPGGGGSTPTPSGGSGSPTPTPTPTIGPTLPPKGFCRTVNDCDTSAFCLGPASCVDDACMYLSPPCTKGLEDCDEKSDTCVPVMSEPPGCVTDLDCISQPGTVCDTSNGMCVDALVATCGPGAGNCFILNGTPGCELRDCCRIVCAMDPTCCSVSWTESCAASAIGFCTSGP